MKVKTLNPNTPAIRSNGMEMINDNEEIDWLDLPFDLLFLIIDKVISFSLADYIRFGCVCNQWRSFLIKNYEQFKLSNVPVLLSFDYHYNSDYQEEKNPIGFYNYYDPKVIWQGLNHEQKRHNNTRSFFSIFDSKVYDFQLPVPSYMNCRGSSHGWLLLVEECRDDGTYPVHLLNPFISSPQKKKNKIHLPPLSTFSTTLDSIENKPKYSFFLRKAIFSKTPSMSSFLNKSNPTTTVDDEELIVFGLTNYCDIEFCRPGDRGWTQLPVPIHPSNVPLEYVSPVYDIIFYKGQLWGILHNGVALTFDIYPEPKFTIVVYPHPEDSYAQCLYLVESVGDLFQVRRYLNEPDDGSHLTKGFQVFKLDQGIMQWVETNTLDGCMFFLGDNASVSVSIADYFPSWCKPNSIFFTDDYSPGYCTDDYSLGYCTQPGLDPHDAGVFNLEDCSFRRFCTMEYKDIMPSPIWIQPMP